MELVEKAVEDLKGKLDDLKNKFGFPKKEEEIEIFSSKSHNYNIRISIPGNHLVPGIFFYRTTYGEFGRKKY